MNTRLSCINWEEIKCEQIILSNRAKVCTQCTSIRSCIQCIIKKIGNNDDKKKLEKNENRQKSVKNMAFNAFTTFAYR